MLLQMLGLSLLFFRSPKSTAARLMRAASGAITATISSNGGGSSNSSLPKQGWIGANLPIILMYSPVHVFFSAWVLSYVFLPLHVALAGWVAFLVPYYGFTQGGRPAHTGVYLNRIIVCQGMAEMSMNDKLCILFNWSTRAAGESYMTVGMAAAICRVAAAVSSAALCCVLLSICYCCCCCCRRVPPVAVADGVVCRQH